MRLVMLACVFVVASSTASTARQPALFEFDSAFWMNLHHYLHALTRPVGALPDVIPSGATADERERWREAVEYYASHYGPRSLLFDAALVQVRQSLIIAGASADLRAAALTPEHRRVLEGAAAIYRKYWWTDHDASNQRFIAGLRPLLTRHGAAIAPRLAASFDSVWPTTPIRVDLVHDAGPPGNAYTLSEPTLIAIGVSDSRHRGLAALELVFHEASHRWDGVLMKDVQDVARDVKRRAPPGLWHGLLFYNAGAITAEALAARGVREYEMYMFAQRTFDFPGWHQALARHWPGFLDGNIARTEAIARILRDLTPAAR